MKEIHQSDRILSSKSSLERSDDFTYMVHKEHNSETTYKTQISSCRKIQIQKDALVKKTRPNLRKFTKMTNFDLQKHHWRWVMALRIWYIENTTIKRPKRHNVPMVKLNITMSLQISECIRYHLHILRNINSQMSGFVEFQRLLFLTSTQTKCLLFWLILRWFLLTQARTGSQRQLFQKHQRCRR